MLFVELMDKRKKHFARLGAEKIRSKPPTKSQKRNQICTYLNNMENYKHIQLKNKIFKEIQVLFNNNMKSIESFVPMDTELVKGSEKATEGSEKAEEGCSKRATDNLEQEDAKRQRIEEENKSAELKRCLEIILMMINVLHQMWNDMRLQVDCEVDMAYDLLRLIRRQIYEGYVPE
uniref:Uncharacterized protein n=1 Tax=Tanacetum cinerariifolium TaxID=118510 RepID=A0A6L2NYV9_TANCI|nr:hypothetical protein [Tanacetum cinerariifolium]